MIIPKIINGGEDQYDHCNFLTKIQVINHEFCQLRHSRTSQLLGVDFQRYLSAYDTSVLGFSLKGTWWVITYFLVPPIFTFC